jgi:hypothetical protein
MKKRSLVFLCVSILLPISGLFIKQIGSIVPFNDLIIFLLIVIVVLIIQIIINAKYIAIGFRANEIPQDQSFPCHVFTDQKNCCVHLYQDHLSKNNGAQVIASQSFFSTYKLMSESDMFIHENEFGKSDASSLSKKEVWIFSYDLSSEVSDDAFKRIAANNVNAGVKYIYFHLKKGKYSEFNEEEKIRRNKLKIFENVKDEKKQTHIKFIIIDNKQQETENLNILPLILGSITFVDNSFGETPKTESFFSLRGDSKDKRPIYFRMPRCMRNAYYNYFLSLIKAQNKKKTKRGAATL